MFENTINLTLKQTINLTLRVFLQKKVNHKKEFLCTKNSRTLLKNVRLSALGLLFYVAVHGGATHNIRLYLKLLSRNLALHC